jgi:hypothetical protein
VTPPAAAVAARTVQPRHPATPQRPLRSAPRPRRISGPTHPGPARSRREHAARAGSQSPVARERGLALALPAALRSLSNHRLIDRLIAGKAWIFVVAFALIGIVTLQLALLELNSSIGRALERGSALQRENAALSIENSEMAAGDRVETSAAHLGMEIVPSGALRFLTASPGGDVARAASALAKPLSTSTAGSSGASASTSASTSPGEASTASSAAPARGEAESSSAPATPPPGETTAAPSGEAPAASGAASSASAPASSSAPVGAAPASAAPSAATAGSGEAGPGGGTQSGPTG